MAYKETILDKIIRLCNGGLNNSSISKKDVLKSILSAISNYSEEPVSEDLEKAAKECCFNLQLQEYFKKGAKWQKQQLIKQSLEAVREEFPDGTFIYSTKKLIDDDMEERGICLFDYRNVRIVLIQSV